MQHIIGTPAHRLNYQRDEYGYAVTSPEGNGTCSFIIYDVPTQATLQSVDNMPYAQARDMFLDAVTAAGG